MKSRLSKDKEQNVNIYSANQINPKLMVQFKIQSKIKLLFFKPIGVYTTETRSVYATAPESIRI